MIFNRNRIANLIVIDNYFRDWIWKSLSYITVRWAAGLV